MWPNKSLGKEDKQGRKGGGGGGVFETEGMKRQI